MVNTITRSIFLGFIFGLLVGYIFISPLAMVLSDQVHASMEIHKIVAMNQSIWISMTEVFTLQFWPWSLTFSTISGFFGIVIMLFVQSLRQRYTALDDLKKYKTITDQLSYGSAICNRKGILVYHNRAFAQIYGAPENDLTGKSLELFYLDDEEWKQKQQLLRMEREYFQQYEQHKKLDGTPFSVQVNNCVITTSDAKEYYAITVMDMSKQKKAEEEKQKLKERLEQAKKLETMGLLAGRIAHDLNNLLSALVGYPDLILKQIPQDTPIRKYVQAIQQSGEKAAAVVEDLLTLAKRGYSKTQVIRLSQILDYYAESLEYEELKKKYPKIEFQIICDDDLLNIVGSSIHIFKVAMNLVLNAAESIVDSGKITIEVKNEHLIEPIEGYETIRKGDYVSLRVKDTGVGIAPDKIKQIFEPFYSKKPGNRQGTGLGMAIILGTVKDHKGYINIESTEGKGSSLTIYFPATRQKQEKEIENIPVEKYMGNGERILIVEDDFQQRKVAKDLLEQLGYEVETVASGEMAIEKIAEWPVDFLVLDMIMENGIDGYQTFLEILKFNPHQKAIIVSGYSISERIKKTLKMGVGGYVQKPYTLEKIGIAIKKLAEQNLPDNENQQ